MSVLERVSWERLLWDTNRMRKPTQRTIHATSQERASAATTVTEHTARELAGLIDPLNLEESLQRTYQACREPHTVTRELQRHGIRDVLLYLKINLWWAEEWSRADSPFKVQTLNDDEHRRHLEILRHLAKSEVFPRLSRDLENLNVFPDAIIICEAAALGRHYLMTEDQLDETIDIQHWSEELFRDGLTSDPEFVVLADHELRTWANKHRGFALETVATAFWPPNPKLPVLR